MLRLKPGLQSFGFAQDKFWFSFPGDFNTGGDHTFLAWCVSTPIRTLHARIGNGLECDSLTSDCNKRANGAHQPHASAAKRVGWMRGLGGAYICVLS